MFGGLFVASLVYSAVQLAKEKFTPTITAEQWGNKELIHKDIMSGASVEQQIKNAQNGKYIVTEKYPEPHRDKNGKVIIENCTLWNEDLKKYGAYQTMKWVRQGKYNLTPEELEKERKKHQENFEKLLSLVQVR